MNPIADGYESRRTNACALLNDEDFARIINAAEAYLSSRSVLTSFISTLGDLVHRGLNTVPEEWREQITVKIRDTLVFMQSASMVQMDDDPGRASREGWYTGFVVLTGLGGGSVGLPSLLAELPITTGLMLRSIADIGRAHGERLEDPLFRTTCIEVFAYGTPIEEDEEELAFIAARLGAIGAAKEAAEFIARVAVRYMAALAPKIAAMSVPITGSVLGAGLNWAYMGFYQSMARVLFTLLPIERKHDPAQVRSCFASMVRELREQQAARGRSNRGG